MLFSKKNYFIPSFFFLIFLYSSCENDIAKVNLITAVNKLPSESGKNVEVIYSDSARVKIKLTAPVLNRFEGNNPYSEFPKGLVVLFYDETLNVKSKLTANYAIRYERENRMEAKNDVVVINAKGEKLNTEHLIWDEKKQIIYSKEFVKITTADEIIMGEGFEANQTFTKYKINKIKGTINLKDE